MISIAMIFEKLKKPIFNSTASDSEELEYFQREQTIKKNILRVFNALEQHSEKPDLEYKLTHWQKGRIEKNQKLLVEYIEILYEKLDREKIINYCKNRNPLAWKNFEDDELIFLVNSYYGSIIYDVLWAEDISVSDVIKISQGKVDIENLNKKIPDKIKYTEKTILTYLEKSKDYKIYCQLILDSIKSYQNEIYLGSSALLLIAIEGLVRKLGSNLIKWQNLEKKHLITEYNSLDKFLRTIPWKEDFSIDKDRLMFITGDFIFRKNSSFKENDDIKVNLKTRLDFLRRTFKGERDLILHGEKSDFGEVWDLYRNFSALNEVFLVIKQYDKLYN